LDDSVRWRFSITLPAKLNVDSKEIVETGTIIISLAKIDKTGYVLL
jgi:hypothetical protein